MLGKKQKQKTNQEMQFGASLGLDVLIGLDEKIVQDELGIGQCRLLRRPVENKIKK